MYKTRLSVFHALSFLFLPNSRRRLVFVLSPHFTCKKTELREVEFCAQGLKASEWLNPESKPVLSESRIRLRNTALYSPLNRKQTHFQVLIKLILQTSTKLRTGGHKASEVNRCCGVVSGERFASSLKRQVRQASRCGRL